MKRILTFLESLYDSNTKYFDLINDDIYNTNKTWDNESSWDINHTWNCEDCWSNE